MKKAKQNISRETNAGQEDQAAPAKQRSLSMEEVKSQTVSWYRKATEAVNY